MRLRTLGLVALISGSVVLLAGEFWQDKQPSDWTDKEVQRLVTKSPWAKEASPTFNPERMSGMGPGGGMGGPGAGGPDGGPGGGPGMPPPGMEGDTSGSRTGGGAGGPPGGMGRGGPGRTPSTVTVKWDSAAPLRAAAARGQASESDKKIAEWSQDYYVVTVSGMGMMRPPRRDRDQEDQSADQERTQRMEQMRQQMQERTKTATALKIKGKDAIAPARVETIATGESRTTSFLFPRSAAIDMDDKEVSFETAMGPLEIKVKFTLKDMLYGGKLAL